MRTTIDIEDDVLAAAKDMARRDDEAQAQRARELIESPAHSDASLFVSDGVATFDQGMLTLPKVRLL